MIEFAVAMFSAVFTATLIVRFVCSMGEPYLRSRAQIGVGEGLTRLLSPAFLHRVVLDAPAARRSRESRRSSRNGFRAAIDFAFAIATPGRSLAAFFVSSIEPDAVRKSPGDWRSRRSPKSES